ELVAEFDPKAAPACAIIKHANPCGVALGTSLKDAYLKALACDSVSAFGGVLAFNQTLDGETAEEISRIFTEVIIAPDANEDARRILAAKKNLRLLTAGGLPDPLAPTLTYRSVAGGFLVQTRDNGRVTRQMLKVVTKRQPTEQEFTDMLLAFTIGKHVKSNAIVYVKDGATAEEISKIFTEVIIAPDADEDAKRILAGKKNLRLLTAGGLPDPMAPTLTYRSVAGGFLVQTRDNGRVTRAGLKVVTKRQPTEQEITDMLLAFTIGKHVKSNAIIYVKDGSTAGIGAGQMSRVDSARIAAIKAKDAARIAGWDKPRTVGSAAASEAFFPFPDGLLVVAEAGATAVIQPGGSVNDQKVIDAADEAGLAMVFTGMRHFRH
ncbi:MAG TPA: hypothetical protein VHM27_14615, partial [Rhizomicrobium sp.]|nr:hypothetical protein [Rhizomicrobium sp.]